MNRRTLLGGAALLALTLGALPAMADPAEALAALQDQVLSTGPNGEEPTPASEVTTRSRTRGSAAVSGTTDGSSSLTMRSQ